MLKNVYSKYFQKSRVFLYPLLGIYTYRSILPIKTFVQLEGYLGLDSVKLIALYHLRDDKEYTSFEKKFLLGNSLFCGFEEVESDDGVKKGIYIFDLSDYSSDYMHFLDGKYSKFSEYSKSCITKYFENGQFKEYIDSYLYPEKYYTDYSVFLDCDVKSLQEAGELCDKPDLIQEKLTAKIIPVNI